MQNTSAQRVVGVDEYGREIDQDGDLIFELRENMLDDNNRPVIAAIKPYGKGNYYDVVLDTNLIKSGYGRNNFYDFVDTAVKEKRVLFADKKSSQRLNGKWVQFPNSIESIDYNNSLSQYKQNVKFLTYTYSLRS